MTSALRSWRLLVGLKERCVKRERETVRIKSAALDACETEFQSARDQLSQASSQHAQSRQRMLDKIGGTQSFKPEIVPLLRSDVERCEQVMRRSSDHAKAKETQFAQAQEALSEARAVVARIEYQLQRARERLKEALVQVERESDDAIDEDAEDTAVARMLLDRAFTQADADPNGRMQF